MGSAIEVSAVKIEGLSRAMTRMKKTVGSLDSLKGPLREISNIGARNLRNAVPVDTGKLKGTVRPMPTTRKARIGIGGRRPLHYAPFPNYGTHRQRAQRFIDKAIRFTQSPAIRIYEREIKKTLRKELGS